MRVRAFPEEFPFLFRRKLARFPPVKELPDGPTEEDGKRRHSADLLPLVYDQLRCVAQSRMRQEKNSTLSATSLVHEAYLRMTREEHSGNWVNKAHYFAAAAETMRRILIDRARSRLCEKRGGDYERTDLSFSQVASPEKDERLIAVSDALDALEAADPDSALLAKLRYFAGMNWEEISTALGKPERTLRRQWSYARAWLRTRIESE